MSDGIINLRRLKKQKQRALKRLKGDQNAARFGEVKSLKDARKAEETRRQTTLDQHKTSDD